jgi:hypothetical protein
MRLRVYLVLLVLAAGHAPAALAADTEAAGGPGGDPFAFTCSDGRHLIGLAGRFGDWIDQVRPVCGAWSTESRRFQNIETGIPFGTSPGQIDWKRVCPRAYAIRSLTITPTLDHDHQNQFVDDIGITCVTVEAPIEVFEVEMESLSRDPGVLLPYPSVVSCPADEVAVGMHGRAGLFVDALGLVCGRAPMSLADGALAGPGEQGTTLDRPILQPESNVGAVLGANACTAAFVPRRAGPTDDVCVTPESHARVVQENASAASRRDPKGKYGPHSCIAGFVWREAFAGDVVCVTPEIRKLVRQENEFAASRSSGPTQLMRRP